MATIRVEHTKNYITIPRATILDKRLSFGAMGFHHFLLALKHGEYELSMLINDLDGPIQEYCLELQAAGYLKKVTAQSWEVLEVSDHEVV